MNYKTVALQIKGMDCASCAVSIEKELKKIKGIIALRINYADEKALIDFDERIISVNDIVEHIKKIGYNAFEVAAGSLDAHKLQREKELYNL